MQASSDLNVLDFDIPFAFIFVVAPAVELTAALIIMTYVTWQVIIIALLALAATKVVQVHDSILTSFLGWFMQQISHYLTSASLKKKRITI